jgi:hypothetical protein
LRVSAVLDVRPSVELKQALSASAEERGLNLNSTACALIEQGSTPDSILLRAACTCSSLLRCSNNATAAVYPSNTS